MTSPKHPSGTDRIAEVAVRLKGYDIVLNIQGDEPFIPLPFQQNCWMLLNETARFPCQQPHARSRRSISIIQIALKLSPRSTALRCIFRGRQSPGTGMETPPPNGSGIWEFMATAGAFFWNLFAGSNHPWRNQKALNNFAPSSMEQKSMLLKPAQPAPE